jgi:PTH1 family peptidyl-tRNA hydrolase
MRVDGQAAGNNGIKSVIQHIGSEFGRIRIGIKNDTSDKADASNFVLGKFTKSEQAHLPALITEVCGIMTEWLYGGQLPHDTRSIILD